MTKIEEVIRQVSDLRDFLIKLQRLKKASRSAPEQASAQPHKAATHSRDGGEPQQPPQQRPG